MSPRKLTTIVALLSVLGLGLSVPGAQTVVYVDDDTALGRDGTSWETAYKYLQDALIGAAGGTEIRVAQSTYKTRQDERGLLAVGERLPMFQPIRQTNRRGWSRPPDMGSRQLQFELRALGRGDQG